MTTFWPPRERRMEGRRRLSCGSFEWQTRQGQPSVGTPIEVPEPRTVIFSGVRGILPIKTVGHDPVSRNAVQPGLLRPRSARFRLGLRCRLSRNGLVDLDIGHFEFAEQVEQQIVFFGSQIAFGLIVQGVEHVDQFASGVGIDHGLAGTRVGVGAENHGGILAEHADEVFESGQTLWRVGIGGGRAGRSFCFFAGCGRSLSGFRFGFALLLFDDVLAQFACRSERPAVNDAKRIILFMIGQGQFPSDNFEFQFNMAGPRKSPGARIGLLCIKVAANARLVKQASGR